MKKNTKKNKILTGPSNSLDQFKLNIINIHNHDSCVYFLKNV